MTKLLPPRGEFADALRNQFLCGAKHKNKAWRRHWTVTAVSVDTCAVTLRDGSWSPFALRIQLVERDLNAKFGFEIEVEAWGTNITDSDAERRVHDALTRLRNDLPIIREGVDRVRVFFESRAKLTPGSDR